ncbi:MAG: hypothetical protein ACPGWM_09665, partial [Flavobacteriales bacterium]
DYWYLESIPEISNPLLQLEYRGGILLGNTSNGSIRSNNPSDIPTNHVRFNELIPLEPLNSEELRFSMSIDNLGSNSVNSLSIEVQIDSVFHSIVNWTGSISPRTVGQEIEVSFPTILTILDKNYQFNFTEINDETNNYSEEASQAVRFQRSLIEGTVSLGPNGDFETMEEFGLNLNTATLCGDLTILLENGVYERFTSTSQGPGLRFSQEGYKISFKAGNDIAPNVIIRGQFAITGDQSAGSALNIQPISVINNPDLKIQQAGSVFVGFGEVNLKKFDSEAPLNLMQGTALAISHCDEANVMDSNFNYGWRGLSFQGNYGSSINITQCTFQDVTLGIEMAHHIGEARIDQCSFSEVSQALDAKNTSHVSFSNNRCLELTSDHSLIHAAPSQEGQNKPFLEITNNIFENNSISTFIEMDANAFILHNIFIRNGPTNGLFPIISIQNEEAIYTQI